MIGDIYYADSPMDEGFVIGVKTNDDIEKFRTTTRTATTADLKWPPETLYNDAVEELKNTVNKLQDQVNETLFTDEILEVLLHDKIIEMANQVKEEFKKAEKKEKKANIDKFINIIKAVYFVPHQGLTKVIWKDGTQTEVRCQDGDEYNKEAGLALCIIKYLFGNTNYYNEIFKSVFEKQANLAEKKTSVKKTKKAPVKKRKRLPSREVTGFEW